MDPRSVDEILGEVTRTGTRFPVLAAAIELHASDLVSTEAVLGVARQMKRDPDHVADVISWVGMISNPPSDLGSIVLCESVSCTAGGAHGVKTLLLAALERLRSPLAVEAVHCLAQCDFGPSVRLGSAIYVGAEERIVHDERSWRP